jgi:RNA polymerase sigma-32 factor
MLTHEEEIDLATRLRDNNDLSAAQQMVMSHLRLVVSIAVVTSAMACHTPI